MSELRPELKKSCTNHTPPSFVGHWRDWHRGHGCDKDDGKPRSDAATLKIEQIAANADARLLTDAQLRHLRAATTSGDDLLVRALDELLAWRSAARGRGEFARLLGVPSEKPSFDHSARTTKHFENLLGYCVRALPEAPRARGGEQMLTAKRGRRKIHALVMREPADRCLGVVQCALPGCEAYMPIVTGKQSAGDQCDWFLDIHECRALRRSS